MATFTFEEAYDCVITRTREAGPIGATEVVPILEADGRVLAEDVPADRDYPPVARSVRDGFALRASETPGRLHLIGEVRAGESFQGSVNPGECVEIMTGAPMPAGADAVVMVEHVGRDDAFVMVHDAIAAGANVNPQGAECRAGDVVLARGIRIDFTRIAMAATVGRAQLQVYRRPRVAILPTGDEVIAVDAAPESFQVRNSNAYSLAVQVKNAGGEPWMLPVAPDQLEATRELIGLGLEADLLLLSGGVSAGKYDLVEQVLSEFGADFYFDRVKIQPGQPLVFGRAQGKLVFGLPGNPASTMVTFELFARPAIALLSGEAQVRPRTAFAKLTRDFSHKPVLKRFLPAILDGGEVTPVPWKGSGDVPALAKSNAFLIAEINVAEYKAGDSIGVVLR